MDSLSPTSIPHQSPNDDDFFERISSNSRFGIGEWYGYSFYDITPEERKRFVTFRPLPGSKMKSDDRRALKKLQALHTSGKVLTNEEEAELEVLRSIDPTKLKKSEQKRLTKLEDWLSSGTPLRGNDINRLNRLLGLQLREREGNLPCPFKSTEVETFPCTKKGGVCSLRLYQRKDDGSIQPFADTKDPLGGIRATCPNRFHEKGDAFSWAGEALLNQSQPSLAREVGFLESERKIFSNQDELEEESSEDTSLGKGEDVGRIDLILVDRTKPLNYPLPWAALEVQAVYFSGPEMGSDFTAIERNLENGGTGLIWPTKVRRPDYRSSGPKRLMPQLQIKVPTLRRWGKKMAVVVDRSFYQSIGTMEEVKHASNSDIAWFVMDFRPVPNEPRMEMYRTKNIRFTTLEEAVEGLTGGKAVAKEEFESRILHWFARNNN
ncbi:MAG TPA: NotI family restriction endonuclease [Noviherbaspirillum sp.]|jgi:hypothetical protein|uniref:NotI family restriction endonuclease n=1 Tax=Noviherbaspirillum sp. TaxID=1926288 RepID=UPI002DDD7867|nr:NotI family restriction endonuclease [Noviherbaspirillum sp.]HEV2610622.1 NotI family restriction endonuclease [Noviherbaspirillum sp.]